MANRSSMGIPSFSLGFWTGDHCQSQVLVSPRGRPRVRPVSRGAFRMATESPRPSAVDVIPSLEELNKRLAPIDFENGPLAASPPSRQQSFRLFSQQEADVRVVFYRDHASWCPYCHKVQLLLEAKRIPYLVRKENMRCYGKKSDEYMRMVPLGLLPAILLDGKLVTESADIMFLLEDKFKAPYKKTIPVDDDIKMQAFHRYIRLERVLVGSWVAALRTSNPLSSIMKNPLNHALNLLEQALGEYAGAFFFGDEASFVDIYYSSMLERLYSTLVYYQNVDVTEGRPNLAAWFAAYHCWEPARYLMSDDLSHCLAIPPQIGGCKFLGERSPKSLAIDSRRSLLVMNDGPERAFARNEAAAALCRAFDVVLSDALKGTRIDSNYYDSLRLAARCIVHVLITPAALEDIEAKVTNVLPMEAIKPIASALRFMRIRVCSPRDMSFDGQEQFCGAINWFIRAVGEVP